MKINLIHKLRTSGRRIFVKRVLLLTLILFTVFQTKSVLATDNDIDINKERLQLFKNVETVTQIPWYYLAAIDQYERNIRHVRKDLPKPSSVISIYIKQSEWSGLLNPNIDDDNPISISFFNGKGVDGNGDGKADLSSDEDVIFAMANHILNYGVDHDNVKIALWDYYKRDKTVSIILGFARLFKHFKKIDLNENKFPLPVNHRYSYQNTWGHSRGWGGRRIHEGTDIFASYGVPVRSTNYGIVEMKGWNRFGGWRVGIRDINNTYHYYAHLSGFAKDLKRGQIVEPGTVIGSVGSTGYGPPGTAGKFPPHLHYGMYKDNGITEWSFDPYPHLKRWERLERQNR